MNEVHKNKIVLQYLESITDAVDKAQELEDKGARSANLRGVLYYWMGIMYEEGRTSANKEVVGKI